MPISFPQSLRGRPEIKAKNLIQKPFNYVPASNLGNPNYLFTADTKGQGCGKIFPRQNPQNPGVNFALAFLAAKVNPVVQPLTDARRYLAEDGTLNMSLSGVTRDSAGVALGNCRVMIFLTEDNSFVTETTSDASGVWSISLLKGGPFFEVCYKTGLPDVSGTSLNTLVPVPV